MVIKYRSHRAPVRYDKDYRQANRLEKVTKNILRYERYSI